MAENHEQEQDQRRKPRDSLTSIARFSKLSLRRTEEAIQSRKQLTAQNQQEIEKEIQAATRMLKLLGDPFKHGDDYSKESMRIKLDRSISMRKAERRAERVRSWKDLHELDQRRIELLKRLATLEGDEEARQ